MNDHCFAITAATDGACCVYQRPHLSLPFSSFSPCVLHLEAKIISRFSKLSNPSIAANLLLGSRHLLYTFYCAHPSPTPPHSTPCSPLPIILSKHQASARCFLSSPHFSLRGLFSVLSGERSQPLVAQLPSLPLLPRGFFSTQRHNGRLPSVDATRMSRKRLVSLSQNRQLLPLPLPLLLLLFLLHPQGRRRRRRSP